MKKKITTDQRQQEHKSGYRPRGSQKPPKPPKPPPKQQPSGGEKGKKK